MAWMTGRELMVGQRHKRQKRHPSQALGAETSQSPDGVIARPRRGGQVARYSAAVAAEYRSLQKLSKRGKEWYLFAAVGARGYLTVPIEPRWRSSIR